VLLCQPFLRVWTVEAIEYVRFEHDELLAKLHLDETLATQEALGWKQANAAENGVSGNYEVLLL
jgi:hypothetical protein